MLFLPDVEKESINRSPPCFHDERLIEVGEENFGPDPENTDSIKEVK